MTTPVPVSTTLTTDELVVSVAASKPVLALAVLDQTLVQAEVTDATVVVLTSVEAI